MPKNNETSIEKAFAELENTIRKLENNQIDLQSSLTAYEQSVGLIREAQKVLENANQRINTVIIDEAPFCTDNDGGET